MSTSCGYHAYAIGPCRRLLLEALCDCTCPLQLCPTSSLVHAGLITTLTSLRFRNMLHHRPNASCDERLGAYRVQLVPLTARSLRVDTTPRRTVNTILQGPRILPRHTWGLLEKYFTATPCNTIDSLGVRRKPPKFTSCQLNTSTTLSAFSGKLILLPSIFSRPILTFLAICRVTSKLEIYRVPQIGEARMGTLRVQADFTISKMHFCPRIATA
jgi:hypothetical protein